MSSVCALFVPDAVVVAGDHAKVIRPWPKVVVKRLTPGSRFLPGIVPALEAIAKEDLLRSDEAEAHVIDLDVSSEWRQIGRFLLAAWLLRSAMTCSMCTGGGTALRRRCADRSSATTGHSRTTAVHPETVRRHERGPAGAHAVEHVERSYRHPDLGIAPPHLQLAFCQLPVRNP